MAVIMDNIMSTGSVKDCINMARGWLGCMYAVCKFPHLTCRARTHVFLNKSLYLLWLYVYSHRCFVYLMRWIQKQPVVLHLSSVVCHTDEPNKGKTDDCGSSMFCRMTGKAITAWLPSIGLRSPLTIDQSLIDRPWPVGVIFSRD